MKMKRMIASVLTLLLVVSILPIGAMADDLPNNTSSQANINQPIGTNSGAGVGITENGSVQTNEGSVRENKGTVVNNDGRVVDNMSGGTVVNNNAGGTVEINRQGGTVEINRQGGTVVNNNAGGTVEFNAAGGTIETNNGTVGYQRPDGFVQPTSGNFGTVETNNGNVLINQKGGTIDTNYGLVGRKDGDDLVTDDDTGNFGTVTTNYGIITQNKNLVVTNAKNDATTIPGNIRVNDGTVKNNEGAVWDNNGKVETNELNVQNNNNNGIVETNNGTVRNNYGTVDTNNYLITDNYKDVGTNNSDISWNYGTVDTNNGKISENHGIVKTNAIDGSMNNFNIGAAAVASNADADSTKEEPVVNGVGTNFGTVVDHQGNERITYYGLSWGDSVDKLNSIESFVESGAERNLDEIANGITRDGYKMTGYTAFARINRNDEQITSDRTTNYLMNAPVWLQIIWEKLGGKSESKATVPNVPTHVAAGDVKEGTLVRCGNMVFLFIEVGEDYILVTTMSAQSKKDMEDPMAYLAKYLTPEQLALLQGNPEQISEELAAKFFGGNTSHIVFKAAKNLFA